MTRLRSLVLVAATLPLLAGGVPAAGCSCGRLPGGSFLVPARVELPANARGLPWFGDLSGSVPTGTFSAFRLDGKQKVPVEVQSEVLRRGPLPVTDGDGWLVLVRPEGGFRPGATYQIEYRRPPSARTEVIGEEPQRVRVKVAREPLTRQRLEAGLKAEDRGHKALDVRALGGSCSTRVLAHQVGLELRLPARLTQWKKAMLFATLVDGSPWQPADSLCNPTPPGRSWASLGSDLAFAACGPDPGLLAQEELDPEERAFLMQTMGSPDNSLASGDHQVEMIAWLPGTDVVLRATAPIRLRCSAAPRTKS